MVVIVVVAVTVTVPVTAVNGAGAVMVWTIISNVRCRWQMYFTLAVMPMQEQALEYRTSPEQAEA